MITDFRCPICGITTRLPIEEVPPLPEDPPEAIRVVVDPTYLASHLRSAHVGYDPPPQIQS